MKNNFYSVIGLLIFAIPFLGIPIVWKKALLSLLGLAVFVYSIWPQISPKLFKSASSAGKPNE